MEPTSDVVRRLWALCSVLRDDGVTYHEYVSELSPILFLNLADILGVEEAVPPNYRWRALISRTPSEVLDVYKEGLNQLRASPDPEISSIFSDSKTDIRSGQSLLKIMNGIDSINWDGANPNSIGDIYEGLIEKNAQESRYGAGQYFTPRAVVDAMVSVTQPQANDRVYDPAAGTAGFLIAAGLYATSRGTAQPKISGYELVPSVESMAEMNLHLHGLRSTLRAEDSLSMDPRDNQCTLCLTNPPFGIKAGLSNEQLALLDFPTNNKQLAFLQHVYKSLRPEGRAGVIVPDNVLFESGQAAKVRSHLLDNYNLHTILRLPTGIFYATGIRTSVLFFAHTGPTEGVWVFDLRSTNDSFTKKRQIAPHHLHDFVEAYGANSLGSSRRTPSTRFQEFTRREIKAIGDRLDMFNMTDEEKPQSSPAARLEAMADQLHQATMAIREMQQLLRGSDER